MINSSAQVKVRGEYNLRIENTQTGEVRALPKQKNIVLKSMWSPMSNPYPPHLLLGSGTTTPTADDRTLSSFIGSIAANDYVYVTRTTDGNNGIITLSQKYIIRGATGEVQGNISELGLCKFGDAGSQSGNLFTRALIKDELGNPTTITLGQYDKLVSDYTISWELDLTQVLLNTTMDIEGVPTQVECHFADYNNPTLSGSAKMQWADYSFADSGNAHFSMRDFVPNVGLPSSANSQFLMLCTYKKFFSGTLTSGGYGDFSRGFNQGSNGLTQLYSTSSGSLSRSINGSSGVITATLDAPLVLQPGTATGQISYLALGGSSGVTEGVNIVFKFTPAINKSASTLLEISNLSMTMVPDYA